MNSIASISDIIFTGLATIISLVSLCKSIRNEKKREKIEENQDKMQKDLNKLEHGKTEMQINKLISNAKKDILDISLKIHDETYKKINKEILLDFYNSYIELELCAYDEACSLYIDEKIDKERFKKNYQTEIRKLFENKDIKEKLNSVDSKFYCLKKIYEEWKNP